MSRIEDVFKRITGAAADPQSAGALDRYAPEPSPRAEEHKVTSFVSPGPHPVDAKPSVRQRAAAPTAPSLPTLVPPATPPSQAHQSHQGESAVEEQTVPVEKLIDFEPIFDYVGFVARSIRRRKALALVTFACAFALTIAGALVMPKTYHVGTRLLAQRNAVMAALSNPGRAVPWDADAPTRAAAETVLRRDNLMELMEKTDLMREWERTRAPVLRLKDWLMAVVTRYEPTPEEKLDAMIGLLENKMSVVAGPVGDGTVSIDLEWRDPEMAFQLVEAAQLAFLDARQKAETDAIGESIAILENYSAELHEKINGTMAELEHTQRNRRRGSDGATRAALATAPRYSSASSNLALPAALVDGLVPEGSSELDARIAELKTTIASKRQELSRVEESRERQISEQQARLAQLTTVYTSSHPSVLSAQQQMAALSQPVPQAITLRRELEDLEVEQATLIAAATDLHIRAELARRNTAATAPAAALPAAPTPDVLAPPQAPAAGISEEAEFASLRLRTQLNQLQSVLERTDGAKIELAVAQSAFKYRYTVIRPAQVPRDPIKPNLKLIVAAGFFASLMLGLVAALGADLIGNKILEKWQIERQLGLPVLGSLETV